MKLRERSLGNRASFHVVCCTILAELFLFCFSFVRAIPAHHHSHDFDHGVETSVRQAGLSNKLDATTVSSNVLTENSQLSPRGITIDGNGGVVVVGIDNLGSVSLSNFDSDGAESWTVSIGSPSIANQVNCLTSSGLSYYVGGRIAKAPDNDTDAGAFVARVDSDGDVDWITTFGSVESGDSIESIAVSSGFVYAGGKVGTLSKIFNDSSSANVYRPLLVKLDSSNGELDTLSTPAPKSNTDDEVVTGLGIDDSGVLFGGGRMGQLTGTNSLPIVYRFKITKGEIISESAFTVKNGPAITHVASSSSKSGRFFAVGGCFLHRVDSSGEEFTVSSTEMKVDGNCVGTARGVAFRDSDSSILVATEKSSKPELLAYGDEFGSLVGRVSGANGLASSLVGPALDGKSAVFIAGEKSNRLFVGGALVSRTEADQKTDSELVDSNTVSAGKNNKSNGFWVKIAAIGGSGGVLLAGILLTVGIVHYVRGTGDPA